jgi:hypothetical protein
MESVENLEIMRILDEIYLDHPYYGCLKKRWICCDYFINQIMVQIKTSFHQKQNCYNQNTKLKRCFVFIGVCIEKLDDQRG